MYQSFIPGVSAPYAINEYQLRLDAQHFLWPVNYIALFILSTRVASWGVMMGIMIDSKKNVLIHTSEAHCKNAWLK